MTEDEHPVAAGRVPVRRESLVVGEGEGTDGQHVEVLVPNPRHLKGRGGGEGGLNICDKIRH